MPRTTAVSFLIVCAWCVVGCSSNLSRAITAFDSADHPKAMEHLLDAEVGLSKRSTSHRARYALYRGLTHLSLGDRESAERWLAEAKAFLDADQRVLGANESGRLLAAWVATGHEPGEWGRDVLRRR